MTLKQYLTIQASEIEGHRIWMQKNLVRKVSWEESFTDWVDSPKHESETYHDLFLQAREDIDPICEKACGDAEYCKGIGNCSVNREVWHRLIYRSKNE